jgi:hypothetical protein
MPKAGDAVAKHRSCDVEHERLFLPSDFSSGKERQDADCVALGIEEAKLREGEAFDALRAIQCAVKTMTALQDKKRKNARGQADNTRSAGYIREAQGRRDHHMATYASARQAMIALGTVSKTDPHSPFPPLTLEDTFMKSRQRGRGLGDSRRTDGMLWHTHRPAVGTSETIPVGVSTGSQPDEAESEEVPREC